MQVSPHHGLQFRLNHSVSFHGNHVLQERTALFSIRWTSESKLRVCASPLLKNSFSENPLHMYKAQTELQFAVARLYMFYKFVVQLWTYVALWWLFRKYRQQDQRASWIGYGCTLRGLEIDWYRILKTSYHLRTCALCLSNIVETEFYFVWAFWCHSSHIREVTKYDYERGYYVPKPESAKQTTSTACDDENDENDEDQEVSPPARKQTTLEEPNDKLPATKSSHHLHSNPLDDSILNKKIGKCISLACNSNLGHTILY